MTKEMEQTLGKQVNVIGEEMYYRNNSTGNPTKIHFIDESTLKTFCGFSAFGAENIVGDESDFVVESQCCQKCLKQMIGNQKLKKIHQANRQRWALTKATK